MARWRARAGRSGTSGTLWSRLRILADDPRQHVCQLGDTSRTRRRLVPDPRLDPRPGVGIATAGTRSREAYAAGMSRLSCRFSVLSSRANLVCSACLNPDLADRYAEVER